jgi:hypothetical protein
MKRKISLFVTLLLSLVMSVCCLVSCQKDGETKAVSLEQVTETMVVMKVTQAEENATALSALTKLKDDGLIDFVAVDSMYGAYITEVNGKQETSSGNSGYSWMLYTSDTEFSSTEYGAVEYNGVEYGQASLGASSLVVKEGHLYIWYYTEWSY